MDEDKIEKATWMFFILAIICEALAIIGAVLQAFRKGEK